MPKYQNTQVIVAISSRALFDLDESDLIFQTQGIAEYQKHQIKNENNVLKEGVAFPLVKKLLAIIDPETSAPAFEVILLSRNSADTGLRIFNSIEHYQLPIHRAVFTSGASIAQYVRAYHASLFLSANAEDVKRVLNEGCAAATIISPKQFSSSENQQLRIAFDGDAVIFSDEAEQIYQSKGLHHFAENEDLKRHQPLSEGPFKNFLAAIYRLQQKFSPEHCPIRTALVTARAAPAHARVIHTLRTWQIRIDEAIFLGGLPKGEFLKAFAADVFFDDQLVHCDSTSPHVATGHVPHGVNN